MQIQARLLFCSTLITPTATLKILSLLEALQPLTPSLPLHVITSSLGRRVATYLQASGPQDCLSLLVAAQQSLPGFANSDTQGQTQPRAGETEIHYHPMAVCINRNGVGAPGVFSHCLSIIINVPNLSCGQQGVILTA